MNKKILSAFTAICVLFTVTGCGSSTSAPAQGADAETVSDAPVKEDASTEEAEKADGEESGEADEAEDGSGEEVTGQYSFKDGDDEYKLDFDFDTDEFINDLEMKGMGEHTSGTAGYPYDGSRGTARELEGNIAVVSAFVSTPDCQWDFDELFYTEAFQAYWVGLETAVKFIEEKSNEYGHSPHFIYDWNEHPELIYKGDVDTDPMDMMSTMSAADQYIDSSIYTADILESTGADQIIYMLVYNTPAYNHTTSYTKIVLGMDEEYPYEMCNMLMNVNDRENTLPSTIAHEMLHTFGAPDLYTTGGISSYFGITQEFIDHLAQNNVNDIMRVDADFDPDKGEADYESVWQDMTEITAYYLGLTDHSDIVEQWGFEPSQHSYYN